MYCTNSADFELWPDTWHWDDVLPYYIKSENNKNKNGTLHGSSGPVSISSVTNPPQVSLDFVEAALNSSVARENLDFNGELRDGILLFIQVYA